MMAYHFDRKGFITTAIVPYHLTDNGTLVREERRETDPSQVNGEMGGRMVETIGASMTLEDNIPTRLLAAVDLNFQDHLQMLADHGFLIMHTTSRGTVFLAPGIDSDTLTDEVALYKLRELWERKAEE